MGLGSLEHAMREPHPAQDDLVRQVDVTVIIPAKNAGETLGDQLSALAGQTFAGAWEVILADNGSTDNTVAVAASFAPQLPALKIIDASERAGSSHARNRAAAAANAELLCFCDADDVVRPAWLDALVLCLATTEIVGGRLDIESLNSADVRAWRSAPSASRETDSIQFAPSGNMGIHRSVFSALGGFNEDYPKSHDVEFGHRARSAGYRIGFCQNAVVAYRLRASLRELAHQAFRAGRATAQNCADHQVPRRPIRRSVGDWAWLFVRIPTLVSRRRRGIWVRRASEAAGRLAGSLRHRVVYL